MPRRRRMPRRRLESATRPAPTSAHTALSRRALESEQEGDALAARQSARTHPPRSAAVARLGMRARHAARYAAHRRVTPRAPVSSTSSCETVSRAGGAAWGRACCAGAPPDRRPCGAWTRRELVERVQRLSQLGNGAGPRELSTRRHAAGDGAASGHGSQVPAGHHCAGWQGTGTGHRHPVSIQ